MTPPSDGSPATNHLQLPEPTKPYFSRQTPVQWFSPLQLLRTAREVVISGIFGSFSDKREVQAALPVPTPPAPTADYSGVDDLWIDYVSDLGDGFDATYTVAKAISAEGLTFRGGVDADTSRGRVLILGGDQVYPTASVEAYRNRLIGPYRSAFPESHPPLGLFAIPGNHDWYDGLTSFMRTFCQRSFIGGWQTQQSRSYFSLKLPGNWWIWGIDIQFDTYIDWPQLTYFQDLAASLHKGDAIILCTAKPSWVSSHNEPDAYANLTYFEHKLELDQKGVAIKLMLTGDTHHYAHYVETNGNSHRITAGGGGAYLSATHHLPEDLHIPPLGMRDPPPLPAQDFKLQKAYPAKEESCRLRKGVFRLPRKNPWFLALMVFVHLLVILTFQGDEPIQAPFVPDGFFGLLAVHPIWLTLLSFAIVGTWFGFVQKAKSWGMRAALGLPHGLIQLVLAIAVAASVVWAVDRLDSWLWDSLAMLVLLTLGGLVASLIAALYLLIADGKGCNTNELFSCQGIEDYKNFVRLHLQGGKLTVYPIGIDKCIKWESVPGEEPADRWLPRFEGPSPEAHLIEHPFNLDNSPSSDATPAPPEEMKN